LEKAFKIGVREREVAGPPDVSTAAIILAAGASRRMGTPKALLDFNGETFLDRLIRIFAPVSTATIVVLGKHAAAIRSGIVQDAHFIVNAQPELGQLSSLQCGLRAIPPRAERIFFTPVDCPAILAETPVSLLAQFRSDTPFVVPRFEGHHGHPVLCNANVAPEFLSLPPSASARDIVHRHTGATRYVDLSDPGILRDVDDPADYQALAKAIQ
jgi:CTP:molybdopterin cytidylyltransferase MocA